ncbi:Uncharacterised protein [Mycobacteroides abscessus subsp. abscessus]|nr:Uncharacterised protein [Mycobacteroides abscessus subsp. abscessus]
MFSPHWRHRLGCTDPGHAPCRNAYESLSHTTFPESSRTTPGSSAAMNPRSASSWSAVLANGSSCAAAAFCSRMRDVGWVCSAISR